MNMDFKRKLSIPMEIKDLFPLTENMRRIKEERDQEIRDIFSGKSQKCRISSDLVQPTMRSV